MSRLWIFQKLSSFSHKVALVAACVILTLSYSSMSERSLLKSSLLFVQQRAVRCQENRRTEKKVCKRSLHVIYSSWFIFNCGQNLCCSVILCRIKVQTRPRLACVFQSNWSTWLKIWTFLVCLCPVCASKNHWPSSHIVKHRVLLHHAPCPNNMNKDKAVFPVAAALVFQGHVPLFAFCTTLLCL